MSARYRVGVPTGSGELNAIRVVVADKNPLVLRGLRGLLEEDERFGEVATVADGGALIALVERRPFDVAVFGWVLPVLSGAELLAALGGRTDVPRAVVYTGDPDPRVPRRVLESGGAAFCSKREPPEQLRETIVQVAGGRMVFPFMPLQPGPADLLRQLTAREAELLELVAEGRTNAEMARHLGLSVNTVKFHLRNLYVKLGVSNRAQATAAYLRARV